MHWTVAFCCLCFAASVTIVWLVHCTISLRTSSKTNKEKHFSGVLAWEACWLGPGWNPCIIFFEEARTAATTRDLVLYTKPLVVLTEVVLKFTISSSGFAEATWHSYSYKQQEQQQVKQQGHYQVRYKGLSQACPTTTNTFLLFCLGAISSVTIVTSFPW